MTRYTLIVNDVVPTQTQIGRTEQVFVQSSTAAVNVTLPAFAASAVQLGARRCIGR